MEILLEVVLRHFLDKTAGLIKRPFQQFVKVCDNGCGHSTNIMLNTVHHLSYIQYKHTHAHVHSTSGMQPTPEMLYIHCIYKHNIHISFFTCSPDRDPIKRHEIYSVR
jgi:hypothetical protein